MDSHFGCLNVSAALENMEENLDVKALRAKFHAKVEMADAGGGGPQRVQLPGFGRGSPSMGFKPPANGAVRPKTLPIPKPLPGLRPLTDLHKLPKPTMSDAEAAPSQRPAPSGVFPRPPPFYRAVHVPQEPKVAPTDIEKLVRARASGELLQNTMQIHSPGQKGPFTKPAPTATSSLRPRRSIAEVPPLRRTLPPEGPRPLKPKRPPYVNLDVFRKVASVPQLPVRPAFGKTNGGNGPSLIRQFSPPGPPRPVKPRSLNQQASIVQEVDDQDTYDDIDSLPPPPPPPPGYKDESWEEPSFINEDEESDPQKIYEMMSDEEEMPKPISPAKKPAKESQNQRELGSKEQKERQRIENTYRKKFKMTGAIEVLHTARVRHDWQGGKNDLVLRQGDSVEIIRVKNNPEGKWLARTLTGTYGYISNTCVDVDYEEVKRSILSKSIESCFPTPPSAQNDEFYDDVGFSDQMNSSINQEDDEVYDDVQPNLKLEIPNDFPPPPPELRLESKKQQKEEKEFRKKFKFEGPINVLYQVMVAPNAPSKKGGGKDLPLVPGEILEVIKIVNKKALCRNGQGKYGYAPRLLLLNMEGGQYDEFDNTTDVYDNDSNTI